MRSEATLQELRAGVVRDRVMESAAAVLVSGEDLTFAKLAEASGVPERTIYRHFPNRAALLGALYAWTNERVGFDGRPPRDATEAGHLVRTVFPGFDALAPVITELLTTPDGVTARLANSSARRRASSAMIRDAVPDLDRRTTRRVAAIVQLLMSAATWQTLRDYWDMDGREAAEAAALAIQLLLEAAQARTKET